MSKGNAKKCRIDYQELGAILYHSNDLSTIHSDKEQGVISKTLCDKIDGSTKYCYKGQNTLPSLLVVYFRQQRELKKGRIEKSLRNIKRDSYTLLKIDKQYQYQ